MIDPPRGPASEQDGGASAACSSTALQPVSVVTPVFNMAAQLEPTIRSVLCNLQPVDEYFIVDGGSTDGTVEMIRRHERRLTGWISAADQGYADALHKGFSRAAGGICCWINAGDLLLRGALDAARKALRDTGADMIFGDDFYIDEQGKVISFSRGYVSDLRAAMLYGGWTPLQDACFWRRELYERVGGIDPALRYAADYDLFLRMALAGSAAYVPLAFSAFRRHAGQKSIAGSQQYSRERKQVRRRELSRSGSRLGAFARSAAQAAAVRWRVHVSQKRWTRPDLHGRPIAALDCGSYWPARPPA